MKKVMLHLIMPDQVSGPNNAAKRISESFLSEEYEFDFLIQKKHAGGKINFSLLKDLVAQIKEFDPDVIHLSGLQSSGFHAVLAARIAGYSNVFLTVRGFSEDSMDSNKSKKYILSKIIEPITLKLSKKVSVVTKESLKKKVISRLPKKKFVGIIHNAAPVKPVSTKSIYRKDFGFFEDDFIVVIVGRMVVDKGIYFIADAAKNIKNKNIKFVFVGDGPCSESIENTYKNEIESGKIVLLGQVDNVIDILQISDVFLFATLHENLSNALLEAMTVGLPVICTSVGGNLEVVEDGVNGYYIQPSDSKDIEEKVLLMYGNKKNLNIFSDNSRKIIEKKFSQETIYKLINQVYKDML